MRTLKPHERNPGKMTFTTASGLLPAGIAVSSGGRTELVWKCDIQLGCKALRLKAKDAGQIDYCQLPKLAVVKASLADFQSEPRRASADSSISTASCRLWRAATV